MIDTDLRKLYYFCVSFFADIKQDCVLKQKWLGAHVFLYCQSDEDFSCVGKITLKRR